MTCSKGSTGRLAEARDDHVVALLRPPWVEVDAGRRDLVGDAVAKRIRERVLRRGLVDVDGVDVGCAIACQLHRQQAAAAADVEATLPSPRPRCCRYFHSSRLSGLGDATSGST